MSPLQAMERSYATLKSLLREGAYPPGYRLEANRIADDVGVSMTPVRDALNRLVGERLVEASSGDGFHVVRLSEGDLRDLYEWHSALVFMAARTVRDLPTAEQLNKALSTVPQADATAAAFALLAEATPNMELRAAINSTSDRLHPFRQFEGLVLRATHDELADVILHTAGQRAAIRRYHAARMRAVPDLVRARAARK